MRQHRLDNLPLDRAASQQLMCMFECDTQLFVRNQADFRRVPRLALLLLLRAANHASPWPASLPRTAGHGAVKPISSRAIRARAAPKHSLPLE